LLEASGSLELTYLTPRSLTLLYALEAQIKLSVLLVMGLLDLTQLRSDRAGLAPSYIVPSDTVHVLLSLTGWSDRCLYLGWLDGDLCSTP